MFRYDNGRGADTRVTVEQLQDQLASEREAHRQEVDRLTSQIERLERQLEQSERGGAAPSRDDRRGCAREDDRRAAKHGRAWASSSEGVWKGLRGQFWHPSAYASLGRACTRNTSAVAPYAAQIHERLFS